MSDEDDHDSCDHDGPHGHFVLPEGVAQMLVGEQDRAEMVNQAKIAQIYNFYESLDKEQCLGLRLLLGSCGRSPAANFYDGIAVGTLLHKFHVDPVTGDPELSADAAATQ